MANEKRKRIKKEIPPKAGLLVLAHLTMSVSLPERMPILCENLTNKPLITILSITATTNNMKV
jgi:hypothetical protein